MIYYNFPPYTTRPGRVMTSKRGLAASWSIIYPANSSKIATCARFDKNIQKSLLNIFEEFWVNIFNTLVVLPLSICSFMFPFWFPKQLWAHYPAVKQCGYQWTAAYTMVCVSKILSKHLFVTSLRVLTTSTCATEQLLVPRQSRDVAHSLDTHIKLTYW